MRNVILLSATLVGVMLADQRFGQRGTTILLPATAVYAVDGDTIDHGDDRYRLVGFDTPETYRAQCEAERVMGLKAKERLVEVIQTAGQLELEVQDKLDEHDRFLAVGRVGGQKVGAILISEGHARPYWGGKRQPWCIGTEELEIAKQQEDGD